MNKKTSAKKKSKKSLSAKPGTKIELEHLPNAVPTHEAITGIGAPSADYKVNADDELVALLGKAKQSGVSCERAEEFACMEFILGATSEDANLFSLRQALKLTNVSVADAVIRRLEERLLCVKANEGVTQLQALSVEKLDSDYFMSLSTSEIEYLHYFSKLYSNYTYCKTTYTDRMRKRIADILEGTKDEKKLKALFESANAIDRSDPPSNQQTDLMAEIPTMDEGQIKLMSLLAEHFRFVDWQPSEQYGSFKKSGDPLDFTKRVYAERLTGNFCVSDIKPYDEPLYEILKRKKPEILNSIGLPKIKTFYNRLQDEGWVFGASDLCKILSSFRKNRQKKDPAPKR